jgi:hypothetical protein
MMTGQSPEAAVTGLPILRGVEGHFHEVPFFIVREMFGGLPFEIAGGHIGDLVGKPVADAHVHSVNEIYFLVSPQPGQAEIEVEIDGVSRVYESPAAIFVPAGAKHRFMTRRACQGSFCFGIFVPDQEGPGVP